MQSGPSAPARFVSHALNSRTIGDWDGSQHRLGPGLTVSVYKQVATPEQAQDTHKHIREFIAKRISKKVADEVRIMYVPSFAWFFPSFSFADASPSSRVSKRMCWSC